MTQHLKLHILDESLTRESERSIDFAHDVLIGLSAQNKKLPSRYFYDDEGSRLFQQIMAQADYYPTRCEWEILEKHARDMIRALNVKTLNLIDLGAGDGQKTLLLLEAAVAEGVDVVYYPIDISQGAIESAVDTIHAKLPQQKIEGVVAEYSEGVRWVGRHLRGKQPNLLLFLGSNIGNFSLERANDFLRMLWKSLANGDHLLVGFDLKKDIEVLLHAYNDSAGVTSAFNLNLLDRINRELGGNFDVSKFRHYGTYNVFSGAMESFLVSLDHQEVTVSGLNKTFHFKPWEPVHTEYSYKYLRSDVAALAENNGLAVRARFEDEAGWFEDVLLCIEKNFS